MQINLTGNHVDVTPALRDYVQAKFDRIERHFDHVTDIHVILSVEKQRNKAEATVHVTGASLYADAEHEDMYAALDLMADKLDRQVKKHKEKLTDHHRGNNRPPINT
jgi:putative sigma-54 modulation protein